jgi:phosphoribosylformylglycinamidine synthase subunit PurL
MQPIGTLEDEFLKALAFYGLREGASTFALSDPTAIVSALSVVDADEHDTEQALLALVQAFRSVATTGAKPIAATALLTVIDEDQDELDLDLHDACELLGVSLGGVVFSPSEHNHVASVSVVGEVEDVTRLTPTSFEHDGDLIYLVGPRAETKVNLEHERKLGEIMVAASRDGLLNAALDVGDGGLALAMVSMALRTGKGARFWLPEGFDQYPALLENNGGIVCVVPRTEELRFSDMCIARYMPLHRIGVVDGNVLELQDHFTYPVST